MKKLLFACGVLCLLAASLYWVYVLETVLPTRIVIGSQSYRLEVVETDEARRLGLGERESLCPECAMLFVFSASEKYAFWMKGMRFPLDIAWLSGERVVSIQHRVSPQNMEVLVPNEVADRVVEFNAGVLDDVHEGDTLRMFDH